MVKSGAEAMESRDSFSRLDEDMMSRQATKQAMGFLSGRRRGFLICESGYDEDQY